MSTYEWRRAVGCAPCSVYRGPSSEPQHLVRKRWKLWRAECWKKYRTGVCADVHYEIAGLRAAGAAIWRGGKPVACLEDHLVLCGKNWYNKNTDDSDPYGLIDAALEPLFFGLTMPDRLLYCGGDSEKVDVLWDMYCGKRARARYGWLLASRYLERNGRRRFIDPFGVPPAGVRGFVHFILLVGERADVLPPEIWLLILSFCTVDELCFKFVRRGREPCGHCGAPALWWCRGCKAVRYCDERCQRADYKAHKRVCTRPTKCLISRHSK